MRFAGGLTAVLFGTAIVIVQPLIAAALKSEEIYPIAQQITVRIEGADKGSGVIIERQGNTYTVVTNWHVVQQEGSYTIYTPDGKECCTINHTQITHLPNVDLAIFQFTSNQNYRVAEKGNSDQVTGGKTVYIAGYPVQISGFPKGNINVLSGQISSRIPNPQNGYALVYTAQAFKGMSGGPILDEEGKLVGIHGSAGTDPDAGGTATLGIPLKTYLTLAPAPKLPVATAPSTAKFTLARTLIGHSQKVTKKFDNGNSLLEGGVLSVAFSPDGKTLASGSFDKTIKIWNLSTGQELRTLNGYSGIVNQVAFSPDGKTVAGCDADKTIIWNVATGQVIRTIKNAYPNDKFFAISPDGKTLADNTYDDNHTITIWNVATGNEIRALKPGHSDSIRSITFSPDGRTLASGSSDSTIKIWNVATGQEIRTLRGHSFGVSSVAFSPDGKTLASDSSDETIKIWNVATGQEIRTLKGHSNSVSSVAFSPDGRTLASGSYDKTIKIWNLITGEEIRTIKGHSSLVWSVAFSPDGRTLASGSSDATIKIWQLSD